MTIQSDVRAFLKRTLPSPARDVIQKVRATVAPPPIDNVVLAEYRVMPDANPVPRLTLAIPILQKGSDFGGTATGIDIFCALYKTLAASRMIDLRIMVTDVTAETDTTIIVDRARRAGITVSPAQIELVRSTRADVAVRANEIFMTYNWWVTLNFAAVRNRQAELFCTAPKPLVWLMQDYEPGFMGFSSAHLLARAAYDTSSPLWGVINSGNLARYIEAVGHRPERTFVFEPVIFDALRPFLERVPTSTRGPRILVYGRPTIERNCFPALVRGLKRWVRDYAEFAHWDVVSAGVPHEPVDLGGGRKLTSVGKLSLEAYAEMLLGSSVGVSLMASPHPSYPPLEMAHFGLRTVTNGYFCKDLESFHPNILSVNSIAEVPLATALANACRQAAEPPAMFANPDYLRDEPYPFLAALAEGLDSALPAPSA